MNGDINGNARLDIETYLKNWLPQPVERARSFPAEMYTSKQVYQWEQERFFRKQWLYVGHLSRVEQPGSYFTVEVAEQPLVIVRDLAGMLRGFLNVCTHRAGPVAKGNGVCHRFTCLYHAWTFDLAGNLKAAPYMEAAEEFGAAEHALKPIRVETWGAFIFVNLNPQAEPLMSWLGNLPEYYQNYQFSYLVHVYSQAYEVNANWKLYMENSSESYHVSMVHPSLELFRALPKMEILMQSHTYTEYLPFLPNSTAMQQGFAPGTCIPGLSERERQGTSITLLWSNFAVVANPNFVLARMVNPQGLSKTHVRFDWLVPDTAAATSAENVAHVFEIYDRTIQEDLVMLNQVQKGINSLHYTPGRLSPQLEIGTHQFQNLLVEQIR